MTTSARLGDRDVLARLAVQRLVEDWSGRSWESRPWGMWLMLWGAIADDDELENIHSTVPLTTAWFLSASGFVRRDEWSALRYLTLRRAEVGHRGLGLSTGVGLFSMAPYRDQCAVYASAYYGPLNASGFRMEFDSRDQPIARRLWVS